MNTTNGGKSNPDSIDSRYVVSSNDDAHAVALQPDGKIIVAGSSWSPTSNSYDFALARYNPDGRLDTSFGIEGKVTTDFAARYDQASALALQADSKIIVAGYSDSRYGGSPSEIRFALARYNLDGSLDVGFGLGGKLDIEMNAGGFYAPDVALQSDGKVVVMGTAKSSFVLTRYHSNGSLDTSFGAKGLVTRAIGTRSGGSAVAVAPDGKIVALGYSINGDDTASFLTRYNVNGSLDTSFGMSGTTIVLVDAQAEASSFTLQANGKIVVLGFSVSEGKFALARYNVDGSLDASFGEGGLVTTSLENKQVYYGRTTVVALQADSKIVVTGYTIQADDSNLEDDSNFILVRYNSDGSLDASFGEDGTVSTIAGADGAATAMALQADGKIVVAGSATKNTDFDEGGDSDFAVARYTLDGTPDFGFGNGGMATTNFYSVRLDPHYCSDIPIPPREVLSGGRRVRLLFFNDVATVLTFQPDNKLVAAGSSDRSIALVRYHPNGSLDASFGQEGKVTNRVGTYDKQPDTALALIRQADGKLVILGRSWIDPSTFPYGETSFLLRYTADGVPDASFGTNGTVIIDSTIGEIFAVALRADGKLVAAGQATISSSVSLPTPLVSGPTSSVDPSGRGLLFLRRGLSPPEGVDIGFALVRYNPDGSLDTQFGTNGKVTTDFGPQDEVVRTIILQKDGKIIAIGSAGTNPASDLLVVRYHSDGTLDASFGTGGKMAIPLLEGSAKVRTIGLQVDGKLIVADSSDRHLAVARYNLDGTLDASFGTDGKVVTPLDSSPSSAEKVFALALQSNGCIVTAAFTGKLVLVHYDSQGRLDPSFGKNGMVTTIGTSATEVRALAFQEDHKIVVAGSCSNGLGSILALSRHNPDGSLDTSFGKDGKVTTRIGGGYFLW